MIRSVAWLALAASLAGCHPPPAAPAASLAEPTSRLLFDAKRGTTWRGHFELAKDPFGGDGQVWRGTHGAGGGKKIVAINSKGFFVMPDRPESASVRIRLAVRGGLDVRVVMGGDGKFFSFHRTLPAAGGWCDLDLPLSAMAGRVSGGTKVVDITVMHKDPSPAAALYVHSAVLVAN